MEAIAAQFTPWDWATLVLYMVFTTWIGHHFSGKQATIKDFFLAGRSLPWPAVSGSIIATAISGVTFVGVPSMVYAIDGNWWFLQASIGSILARLIIAKWFIPAFYEKEIYSPYDFMANRLGGGVGKLTTLLFFIGAILGQSARVYLTALVLEVITGWDIALSVAVIGIISIIWTWMGGIATVIWTDVVQFFLFVCGGLLALFFILAYLPLDPFQAFKVAADYGKTDVLNLTLDPRFSYTLWAAILAWPFQNLASYGTDQLNAQRFFTCKSPGDASKAIVLSCLSELVTLLMLSIGALLFVYYNYYPLDPNAAGLVDEKMDRIFPVFIVQELPPGVTGLLIAGIFAAAISSLDSILAALSQVCMTTFYQPYLGRNKSDAHYVWVSRLLVLVWGILLSLVAYSFAKAPEDINIVAIVFGVSSYSFGPMLGIFLLALLKPECGARGLWVGVPLSILLAGMFRNALYAKYEGGFPDFLPTSAEFYFLLFPETEALKDAGLSLALTYIWVIPLTTALTFGLGVLLGKRGGGGESAPPAAESAAP
ncbi:MAG: sodium/solute symporter [Verrucomicrobiota bacterium]